MINKHISILSLGLLFPILALACGFGTNLIELNEPTYQPTIAPQIVTQEPMPSVITDEDQVIIELYKRVNPAVINIVTYMRQGDSVIADGQGSGFVYDQEGHIITNAHVIHGADEIEISFEDGTILRGELIGQDLHSDLAVVKVDNMPDGINPIPLGDINDVAVGQTVVAIGNPFGLGGTLTRGIVSALGRTIPALTPFSIPQSIQTDAPINPGNSGGPLLNLGGKVIGVNAQIETGDGSRANSGVGFAIPVSIVARVVPELIESGNYHWAWLGVSGGSVYPALVEAMELGVNKGAYIVEVINGGPSDKAGLRGANRQVAVDGRLIEVGGDIIVVIDDQPVNSFEDLLLYISLSTSPGQEVTLTIIRNGQEREVIVKMEERPDSDNLFPFP